MNLHLSTNKLPLVVGIAPLEAYIDALLNSTPQHVNLTSILFYGGDLLDYTSDGTFDRARYNIKELDFTEAEVDKVLFESYLLIFLHLNSWSWSNASSVK